MALLRMSFDLILCLYIVNVQNVIYSGSPALRIHVCTYPADCIQWWNDPIVTVVEALRLNNRYYEIIYSFGCETSFETMWYPDRKQLPLWRIGCQLCGSQGHSSLVKHIVETFQS
jgi:hypothetical protein